MFTVNSKLTLSFCYIQKRVCPAGIDTGKKKLTFVWHNCYNYILLLLLSFFRAFMEGKGCNVSRWRCDTVPHPRQRDATSCGVFAMKVCLLYRAMSSLSHYSIIFYYTTIVQLKCYPKQFFFTQLMTKTKTLFSDSRFVSVRW